MNEPKITFEDLHFLAGQVFNPNTPVSEKDLFSGRKSQIQRVLDVVSQKGQHVIIFGERGVGKTSLANVLAAFVPPTQSNLFTVRVNCDRNDTFSTVWKNIFNEVTITTKRDIVGFKPYAVQKTTTATEYLPSNDVSPNDVRSALNQLSEIAIPIIVIDEFDRLPTEERRVFADLIKGLSDYSLQATVVLIGVGESVEQIINEHQSVSRALVQVQMPRMTPEEIKEIITSSIGRLGMKIEPKVLELVSLLSKGLPHYAHLIGLNATRDAIETKSLIIEKINLDAAITKGITDAQYSIKTNYIKAITSARKDNIFSDVLLSCALATVNELGEFPAQDVRAPLNKITGRNYDIPAFARHLDDFSSETRGNILIKTGQKRRYRYKFSDPLMQPYTIMQGLISGKINTNELI